MRNVIIVTTLLIGSMTVAHAQQPQPYVPIDEATWRNTAQALGNVPMSIAAHQQVQNIMAAAEQEAARLKKAAEQPKPVEQPKKP